jgi:hypothetical protein
MLALWDWDIMLYRHFYRQKKRAFIGAGDGLGLRGGYSSASIVNQGCEPWSVSAWKIHRRRS